MGRDYPRPEPPPFRSPTPQLLRASGNRNAPLVEPGQFDSALELGGVVDASLIRGVAGR